jgi:hypothetical protein
MTDGGENLSYKDVTDGWTCPLGIERVCVKIELHAQIYFYVLSPVNNVR